MKQLASINGAAKEIAKLHGEVLQAARTTLTKAIRIGELLSGVKARLVHGKWLPWLEANVPFHQTQASRYIRCFQERTKLSNLLNSPTSVEPAIKLLRDPEAKPRGRKPRSTPPPQSNGTKPQTFGEIMAKTGMTDELSEKMERVRLSPAFQAKMEAKSKKTRALLARGLKLSNTLRTLAEACDANGGKLAVLIGEYDIRVQHLSSCDMP